jgi:hypothetical protein
MTNKLHLIQNPVFLTCQWALTGDPTMPLACVWTASKHFQSASTASSTDETKRMPPVRLAEPQFEALAAPAEGMRSRRNGFAALGKACPRLSHGLRPRPDRDGGRQRWRSGVHPYAGGRPVRSPSLVDADRAAAHLLPRAGKNGAIGHGHMQGPCGHYLWRFVKWWDRF